MDNVIKELYTVICDRRENPAEGSYTAYLFSAGLDKILKKIGEECAEVIISAKNTDHAAQIGESCDLIYHLAVLWAELGITPEEISAELELRSGKVGNLKQFRETDRNT